MEEGNSNKEEDFEIWYDEEEDRVWDSGGPDAGHKCHFMLVLKNKIQNID